MKRKSFVTAIVFVMLFTAVFSGLSFFNTGNAYASGIKATLSPDSSTTAIGSSVKVTLSYSGSSIGMIKATVTYDSNLLELTGGGDESCNVYGGGGYAVVVF